MTDWGKIPELHDAIWNAKHWANFYAERAWRFKITIKVLEETAMEDEIDRITSILLEPNKR